MVWGPIQAWMSFVQPQVPETSQEEKVVGKQWAVRESKNVMTCVSCTGVVMVAGLYNRGRGRACKDSIFTVTEKFYKCLIMEWQEIPSPLHIIRSFKVAQFSCSSGNRGVTDVPGVQ